MGFHAHLDAESEHLVIEHNQPSYADFSGLEAALARDQDYVLAYAGLAGFVGLTIVMPLIWQPASAHVWMLFFALGISGGLGHYLVIKAFAVAPGGTLMESGTKLKSRIATTMCIGCFRARFATRHNASATSAMTAHFRPKNTPISHGNCPKAAYAALKARMTQKPGSTNSVPATRPPTVRCRSQPM